MSNEKIGISDISLHIPEPRIDLATIVERRVREIPSLERHLQRAIRTTGQTAIRFPHIWEDTATIAAEAVLGLVRAGTGVDTRMLRHLSVGTESGVDHSKPVSAYVQGMLQQAGCELPRTISSAQVQHACAGGTMALLGVAGLLAAGGREGEAGIVACSDIARYQLKSTAEVTQGAGGAALLVESSPRLVEIDLSTAGFYSSDVDDFFRPLGSTIAQVNGSYSMRCYAESLDAAFLDHCGRRGLLPHQALEQADFLVLHAPFHNIPEMALKKLLEHHLGFDESRTAEFLREKGLYDGIDPLAGIGNLYTASMYSALAFLLDSRYRALGDGIVGKKILFASYGSGSTMVVFSGTVAAKAPRVISRWRMDTVFDAARHAGFDEYATWAGGPYPAELYAELLAAAPQPSAAFYLAGVRKDGYREYARAGVQQEWTVDRDALVEMPRAAAVPA